MADQGGSDTELATRPLAADWPARADLARWVLVALGVLLRLREYVADRSLWRDEASVTYNLLHRSWSGFDHPLTFNQGAPPGFFVVDHAMTSVFGTSELVLRSPAFIASIVSLVVMAILVRRELDRVTGLVALGLFAGATSVIEYGNEVKQYSLDVLVALVIALVVSYAWQARLDRRWCLVLAVTGVVTVWCSHIAPFVLFTAGATVAWQPWRRRDRDVLTRLSLVAVAWLTSWLVLYLWLLRDLGANSFLHDYWHDAFLPVPLLDHGWLEGWHTVLSSTSTLVTGRAPIDLFVAVLAVIGVVRLARRQRGVLAMCLGPWLAVVVASLSQVYPAAERMVLFVVPGLVVLMAAGITESISRIRHREPRAAAALAVVFVLLCASAALGRVTNPTRIEEQRPLITTLAVQALPGDAAYVTEPAEPAFDYYADRLDLSLDSVVIGRAPFADVDAIRAELEPLHGRSRVWIVASAFWQPEGAIDPAVTDALGRMGGVEVARYDGVGATVTLYDLSHASG